ncbi:hypothetical protein SPHINGO361_100518 [Sphingomonas sp. EC-HK361]|nr:hypothetical protein SPHINGO361_100518 [Sphingomonas sp. EC-HK361]
MMSDDVALPRRNPRVLCWRYALPCYARGSHPFARSNGRSDLARPDSGRRAYVGLAFKF